MRRLAFNNGYVDVYENDEQNKHEFYCFDDIKKYLQTYNYKGYICELRDYYLIPNGHIHIEQCIVKI